MKTKRYLLATAGGVVAASAAGQVAANAKDLQPAAASWEGLYVGLHVGANWQQATTNTAYNSPVSTVTHASGFIGGGQVGYNWQHGTFVYGLEADASWLTGKGKTANAKGKNATNRIEWLATARARAGLAVGDTMAYITGGLALGGVKNTTVVC